LIEEPRDEAEQPEEAATETPEEAPAETPEEAPAETPEEAPAETPEEAPAAPDEGGDVAESATEVPEEAIPPAAEPEPEPQISEPEALTPDTPEEVVEERQAEDAAAIEEAAQAERRPRGKASERGERDLKTDKPADVIPGEHLTPDISLGAEGSETDIERLLAPEQPSGAAEYAPDEAPDVPAEESEAAQPETVARTPVELAAEARYQATGKRKRSVARVILRPGKGTYTINGRTLETYFPRPTLQHAARQPLETAGYQESMDVVAKIHGGGVSAQAGALRHGIARALIEVDPQQRTYLKRQGFLTRDARAKERKKAGLKKARKRPQFSKR
jgi:small subunit ribosomal protein S9